MNREVLITGGSGTVARAAGKYLTSQGIHVIGVSRSVGEDSDYFTETHKLDLLDKKDLTKLQKILEHVDAVFHLAWNVSKENFNTGEKWEGNMQMFENVMQAAEKAEVPIFINGSSIHAGTGNIPAYTAETSLENTPEPYRSSIDPEDDYDLRKEDPEKLLDPRDNEPDSPYGESKVETERKMREAVKEEEFEIGVSIRIGGVNPEDRDHLEGEPYYSSLYWSHKDLGRTLEHIVKADIEEKKGYHQFYGVSDNKGRIFNIENSFIGR
ncbi:NAD-dependent epimerase/dehydratase family protein [Candidatus Nanohalobium constans]|uniref:NAD dependent epimerase/dehydratase n=1 Tax=Candidatus Nanohalobium constans TaxID=2565781 RepID=A0A5Q0UG08_9ARCH|nr:NAD(P)-dependent oxidoreductase [Candidatus Nanohalobium constans]QGA80583.1 NAD dependent epimerase/dehydratase [Candidatus Nanohalobium constans]